MTTASRRRLPALLGRRNGSRPDAPIEGTARLGARTKHLVKRMRPGDVAVIDHVNIDRIAAEELIDAGAVAVLNASPSSDGRYPNPGPLMLAHAGVRLIDAPEADLFGLLTDGDRLRIDGGRVLNDGEAVTDGRVRTVPELERAELIVSVGAHFNLIEFLERKRGGMSSTFLTRLRIGEKLVDAKGVSRLYQPTSALAPALLFAVAFLVLLTILIITSPALNDVFELFWLKVRIWLGL